MYAAILGDATLFYLFLQFLLQIDRDLAGQARRKGCGHCGGVLHSADYRRRPRGLGPLGIDPGPEFAVCFSFCCDGAGCRRRHKAPSVRFLDRKVYLSVMVLLLSAMRQGPTRRTARELRQRFGVDRRTLARWRTWWQAILPSSAPWQRARGLFCPPPRELDLPQSLLDRFTDGDLRERIVAALRFLAGLFSPSGAF
jgi:hypothetical protein